MKQERRDVLRDHEFDGIQEFDNQLPMWWLGTFVLTILLALYWWGARETFGTEPGTYEIHAQEWEAVKELQAKPPVEADVLAALEDEAALAEGQTVFETSCFACHGKLGEGGIGPNLTDEYWIHGGQPEQIGLIIFQGVAEKGMPTWSNSLSGDQIVQVTAYVMSLQGTDPPDAKEPQGEKE